MDISSAFEWADRCQLIDGGEIVHLLTLPNERWEIIPVNNEAEYAISEAI